MKRLPRSLDEIGGLRVARWVRESTRNQFDRFGPDSQREQQDRFIERHGLLDTGLVWQVAQSGSTVWRSSAMGAMLAEARAGSFDLLLAGYADRWQRNLRRTLELLEDDLHPAGVALVMCDRRILSSDPGDWDELVAEATGAERYVRRLAGRTTDGYAAKFDRHNDQAGNPPLGFRRRAEPPRIIEIDPETIGLAVSLFERYATGVISIERLARDAGLEPDRVRYILRNPLYAGWVRRHRGRDEQRRPAPWRAQPPVSDELFERVQQVRCGKTRGGGPRNRTRVDLLAGLLECVCGRRIRSDGLMGSSSRIAKLHLDPCPAWGRSARIGSEAWEVPILGQVAGINLGDEVLAAVVGTLSTSGRPVGLDRARLERAKRELALEHAAGNLSDDAYLARMAELRVQGDVLGRVEHRELTAARAVEWLRAFAEAWTRADVPEARKELLHAIYERIVVAGPRFVEVKLTTAAYNHGLAIALPDAVMARPEGFEPPTL